MLSDIFSFMNDCFPNQKLKLKIGNIVLGEEEIRALEEKKESDKKDEQAIEGE